MRKKKLSNRIISDILTFSLLFSMFVNTVAFGAEEDPVTRILLDVTQVLLTIAGLVCMGKLLQIGIMYMTKSIEEKSNAKTAVLPWLIGTIVCFGAGWIGRGIIKILDPGKEDVLSY